MENNWSQGLAWSSEFETGYANIDNEHKKLFKLASDLIESCQQKEKIRIDETLAFLVNYTVEHFADEESLAQRYKYPKFEEHKKMHDDFTKSVLAFVEQYEKNGDSEELYTVVNKIIVRWLIKHIQGEDYKVAEHIKSLERR